MERSGVGDNRQALVSEGGPWPLTGVMGGTEDMQAPFQGAQRAEVFRSPEPIPSLSSYVYFPELYYFPGRQLALSHRTAPWEK